MSVDEILEACRNYLEKEKYDLGNKMFVKIVYPKKDKLGRQRKSKLEIVCELKGYEN